MVKVPNWCPRIASSLCRSRVPLQFHQNLEVTTQTRCLYVLTLSMERTVPLQKEVGRGAIRQWKSLRIILVHKIHNIYISVCFHCWSYCVNSVSQGQSTSILPVCLDSGRTPPAGDHQITGPKLMIRDTLFHSNNDYIGQEELVGPWT